MSNKQLQRVTVGVSYIGQDTDLRFTNSLKRTNERLGVSHGFPVSSLNSEA
jgi:hypothetical protein